MSYIDGSDEEELLRKKDLDEEEEALQNIEKLKLEEILKKKKKKKEMALVTDTELLQRFWGDDKKLDNNDKFLRNYVSLVHLLSFRF